MSLYLSTSTWKVIDKSSCSLWAAAKRISPGGFKAIFDANGVTTFKDSYEHLSATGRLIVYGFHSMLPKQGGRIGCLQMLGMAYDWLFYLLITLRQTRVTLCLVSPNNSKCHMCFFLG